MYFDIKAIRSVRWRGGRKELTLGEAPSLVISNSSSISSICMLFVLLRWYVLGFAFMPPFSPILTAVSLISSSSLWLFTFPFSAMCLCFFSSLLCAFHSTISANRPFLTNKSSKCRFMTPSCIQSAGKLDITTEWVLAYYPQGRRLEHLNEKK